jgi:hypothetical protein
MELRNIDKYKENIATRRKMLKKGFELYCPNCYIFYHKLEPCGNGEHLVMENCDDCDSELVNLRVSLYRKNLMT